MVPSEEPVEHLSALYVEDDDRLARLTAQYLRSHGVEVTVVPRGDQALSEARSAHSCRYMRSPAFPPLAPELRA
ncbi:MAG TPA: hypothetical protein VIK01_10965 [Polyangiaceae bacterium]